MSAAATRRLLAAALVLAPGLVLAQGQHFAQSPFEAREARAPELERVRGKLSWVNPRVRSMAAWSGFDARLETQDGSRLSLRASALVDAARLEALDGRQVEALLHPVPDTPGAWTFHPAKGRPSISQGPSGHDAIQPVEVDGETVAQAQWKAGRSGGHRVIWVRERKGSRVKTEGR